MDAQKGKKAGKKSKSIVVDLDDSHESIDSCAEVCAADEHKKEQLMNKKKKDDAK